MGLSEIFYWRLRLVRWPWHRRVSPQSQESQATVWNIYSDQHDWVVINLNRCGQALSPPIILHTSSSILHLPFSCPTEGKAPWCRRRSAEVWTLDWTVVSLDHVMAHTPSSHQHLYGGWLISPRYVCWTISELSRKFDHKYSCIKSVTLVERGA